LITLMSADNIPDIYGRPGLEGKTDPRDIW
jgi:hypothetical protein